MVHPLVIVEKKRTIGLNQSDNGSPFPLQKLYGEWVQAFGETVCGIVWVDKDLLQLVMVLKATINQSSLTLVHANDPTNRFAGSFYPFSLQFLVERIVRGEYFHLAPLLLFPALGTRWTFSRFSDPFCTNFPRRLPVALFLFDFWLACLLLSVNESDRCSLIIEKQVLLVIASIGNCHFSSHRIRPNYGLGRKSHWGAFCGEWSSGWRVHA